MDEELNSMRGLSTFALIGLVVPLLTGCLGGLFEPGPTEIEARVEAANDLNPDFEGNPSPLVVRFYELKSPTAFNNAGFFALYDSDAAELGDDLQNREEIDFQPGDTFVFERELKPETRWVGIMGAYRDIDNSVWRAVVEVEEGDSTDLIIALGRTGIVVQVD
jgi:type VI secretion system protein VasD